MARKGKIKIASPEEVDELVGGNGGSQPTQDTDDRTASTTPPFEQDGQAEDVDQEAALTPEIEDLKDKLLRARAELKNLQRRSRTEIKQAARFGNTNFARAIVMLVDDFDRTLEAAGAQNATVESVIEGVTLIHDAFLKILEAQGIRTVEAQGRPFDPHVHEAVMQQPSDEHPDQTVLQQVQKGYTLFDRVLRPAKVIISKAKTEASAPNERNEVEPPSGEGDSDADV